MDAETSRCISDLADSLKKMHLATTMEEATARAKDIILSTKTKDSDKPIGEMVKAPADPRVAATFDKVKDELSKISVDIRQHSEEKQQTEQLKKKIAHEQQAVEDAKEFVKMADEVQKSQTSK